MTTRGQGDGSGLGVFLLALIGLVGIGLGSLSVASGDGRWVWPNSQLNILSSRGTWIPAFMIDIGVVFLGLALFLLITSMKQRLSLWRYARRQNNRSK